MEEDRDAGSNGGQQPPAEDELQADKLKARLEAALKLADERLDQLQRCRADLDNVMKRAAREKEETIKYASERLLGRLLPVLDSLEQASKHDDGTAVLYQQLLGILMAEGLAPIEAVGRRFDPYRHEALFQVKNDVLEEDTVAEEIQRGYLFNSRVIRTAKVAVAKH